MKEEKSIGVVFLDKSVNEKYKLIFSQKVMSYIITMGFSL